MEEEEEEEEEGAVFIRDCDQIVTNEDPPNAHQAQQESC